MKDKWTWVISRCVNSNKFIPSLTPKREIKKWTSDIRIMSYEKCLLECNLINKPLK